MNHLFNWSCEKIYYLTVLDKVQMRRDENLPYDLRSVCLRLYFQSRVDSTSMTHVGTVRILSICRNGI